MPLATLRFSSTAHKARKEQDVKFDATTSNFIVNASAYLPNTKLGNFDRTTDLELVDTDTGKVVRFLYGHVNQYDRDKRLERAWYFYAVQGQAKPCGIILVDDRNL